MTMLASRSGRIAAIFLAAALGILGAGPSAAIEVRSGAVLQTGGDFADMLFISGRDVSVASRSTDDIFVAGAQVRVGQTTADHLIVAGSSVRVAGADVKDIIAAAAELTLESGQAQDDVVAAAGSIVIRPAFRIGGSVMLIGARIEVSTPVGGDVVATGGEVYLDSAVGGKAALRAERLVIGPNARIGGDLIYEASEVEISPQAVVSGKRVARTPDKPSSADNLIGSAIAAAAVFLLIFAAGGAVLVLAAVWAFPGLMDRAAGRIETQFLPITGAGFLLVLGGPIAIVLLLMTLIGIPLALVIVALYLASLPLAVSAVVYWAGMRGRRMAARGRTLSPPRFGARLGWSLLAVLVLLVLGLLPLVGPLVWLVVHVVGLGAVVIEARRSLAQA